jgi:hypothetical protein
MYDLLSGKNLAQPEDDYDDNDPEVKEKKRLEKQEQRRKKAAKREEENDPKVKEMKRAERQAERQRKKEEKHEEKRKKAESKARGKGKKKGKANAAPEIIDSDVEMADGTPSNSQPALAKGLDLSKVPSPISGMSPTEIDNQLPFAGEGAESNDAGDHSQTDNANAHDLPDNASSDHDAGVNCDGPDHGVVMHDNHQVLGTQVASPGVGDRRRRGALPGKCNLTQQ